MEKNPSSKYKIRFNDCDLFGHLNNSRYLDYLINAREDHLLEHYAFDLTTWYKKGVGWVVGSHEIAYASPAVYNEIVTIQSALLHADSHFLHVETVMMNTECSQLKAIMRTRLIPIDTKTGKKEMHSAEFMSWVKTLENHTIPNDISLQQRVAELRMALKSGAVRTF
ncbi:acyl-CoA thioesterase [Flavobacterium pallidum]|uniref:Acyl-CoA thioesterase n=1 Tax=Flavobacterium pallidum TaxID=2172098 RepID=A0A2S1SK48_9FLAO|nr:acyl-CoA thioesterase [Flavobacterium pallidum]AWI26800.1 acyl-CoA thioesterase [Flavobacterium pallidum]